MGIVVVGDVSSRRGVLLDVVELGHLIICLLLKFIHLGKPFLYLLDCHAVDAIGVPLLRWNVRTRSSQVANASASVTLGGFDPGNLSRN